MATYTVLFDAVNYMRRSELAERPEHVTARRGEFVELEGADAERLVAAGAVVEGEVDPAAYEAEQAAAAEAEAAEAAGDEEAAPAVGGVMPEPVIADDDAEAEAAGDEESTTSSGRRRR